MPIGLEPDRKTFHYRDSFAVQTFMMTELPSETINPLLLVYKIVDGQDIDVEVYLPRPDPKRAQHGYCSSKTTVAVSISRAKLTSVSSSHQYSWRCIHAWPCRHGQQGSNQRLSQPLMDRPSAESSALPSSQPTRGPNAGLPRLACMGAR